MLGEVEHDKSPRTQRLGSLVAQVYRQTMHPKFPWFVLLIPHFHPSLPAKILTKDTYTNCTSNPVHVCIVRYQPLLQALGFAWLKNIMFQRASFRYLGFHLDANASINYAPTLVLQQALIMRTFAEPQSSLP
jgi:hypothetical protein